MFGIPALLCLVVLRSAEHELIGRPAVERRFSQEAPFETDPFEDKFFRPTAAEIRPVSLEVHSFTEVRVDGSIIK